MENIIPYEFSLLIIKVVLILLFEFNYFKEVENFASKLFLLM